MTNARYRALAGLAALGLLVAACGDDDDTAAGDDTTDDTVGEAAEGTTEGEGTIPENQPDVNQDGRVVIGVLSPGDLDDNGYYESFIATANAYADENGWEVIPVGQINPADAVQAARDICAQSVDMVAVAAGELADAVPVAEESVCEGTVWYVAGGGRIDQEDYFVQTADDISESQYLTGAAAGLVLDDLGRTHVAYITGPEQDFSVQAHAAFTAGVRSVIPEAEVSATYTGDFDDAAEAVEAANAVIGDPELGLLYPYLGGATDAVVDVGMQSDVQSVTPGTDRCAEDGFAVSSLFSPGELFAGSLVDFADGDLAIGVTKTFRVGVDPVPDAVICAPTPEQEAALDEVRSQIGEGEIVPAEIVEAAG